MPCFLPIRDVEPDITCVYPAPRTASARTLNRTPPDLKPHFDGGKPQLNVSLLEPMSDRLIRMRLFSRKFSRQIMDDMFTNPTIASYKSVTALPVQVRGFPAAESAVQAQEQVRVQAAARWAVPAVCSWILHPWEIASFVVIWV